MNKDEIIKEITRLTSTIQNEHPELQKYLSERPSNNFYTEDHHKPLEEQQTDEMWEYMESLKSLIDNYNAEQKLSSDSEGVSFESPSNPR